MRPLFGFGSKRKPQTGFSTGGGRVDFSFYQTGVFWVAGIFDATSPFGWAVASLGQWLPRRLFALPFSSFKEVVCLFFFEMCLFKKMMFCFFKTTCYYVLSTKIRCFTGFVIQMEAPKVIGTRKGSAKEVMSMIVADSSGVIQLSSWGASNDEEHRLLKAQYDSTEDTFPKRLVKLQTVQGSSVQVTGYGNICIQPSLSFAIGDFRVLKLGMHETVALRGFVKQVGSVVISNSGVPRRSFLLLDPNGMAVPITLHGPVSEDTSVLEEGGEVLL